MRLASFSSKPSTCFWKRRPAIIASMDALTNSVVQLADQTPTNTWLDVTKLRGEVDRLRAEVAQRDNQIAGIAR